MSQSRFNSLLHRQQVWVYVVGFLFVADFIFYGYLPSHRRLASLEQARVQKGRLIESADSQERALPALEESLKAVEKRVLHYEDNIPTSSNLGPFLGEIADIMTTHALTAPEIQPQTEIATDNLRCIPVRMKCRGTLEGIFGFCNDLQKLERLVRIEKLTLENGEDFGGLITLNAETVIFYRSRRPQDGSGVAGVGSPGVTRNDT